MEYTNRRRSARARRSPPERKSRDGGAGDSLETVTQEFADQLKRDFRNDIEGDPPGFKKQVIRLIRRWLPPRRGRPVNPKTEAAFALLNQGETVRQILRLQIPNFDQLDIWSRMLAEKGLRQALSRQRRKSSPPVTGLSSTD